MGSFSATYRQSRGKAFTLLLDMTLLSDLAPELIDLLYAELDKTTMSSLACVSEYFYQGLGRADDPPAYRKLPFELEKEVTLFGSFQRRAAFDGHFHLLSRNCIESLPFKLLLICGMIDEMDRRINSGNDLGAGICLDAKEICALINKWPTFPESVFMWLFSVRDKEIEYARSFSSTEGMDSDLQKLLEEAYCTERASRLLLIELKVEELAEVLRTVLLDRDYVLSSSVFEYLWSLPGVQALLIGEHCSVIEKRKQHVVAIAALNNRIDTVKRLMSSWFPHALNALPARRSDCASPHTCTSAYVRWALEKGSEKFYPYDVLRAAGKAKCLCNLYAMADFLSCFEPSGSRTTEKELHTYGARVIPGFTVERYRFLKQFQTGHSAFDRIVRTWPDIFVDKDLFERLVVKRQSYALFRAILPSLRHSPPLLNWAYHFFEFGERCALGIQDERYFKALLANNKTAWDIFATDDNTGPRARYGYDVADVHRNAWTYGAKDVAYFLHKMGVTDEFLMTAITVKRERAKRRNVETFLEDAFNLCSRFEDLLSLSESL